MIEFLAKILGIAKSKIEFKQGEKSKNKRLLLKNATINEIYQKISVYDKIDS